jgi:hypothetical protein
MTLGVLVVSLEFEAQATVPTGVRAGLVQIDVDARMPERAVAAVADHHALRHHFGRHRVHEVDREARVDLTKHANETRIPVVLFMPNLACMTRLEDRFILDNVTFT